MISPASLVHGNQDLTQLRQSFFGVSDPDQSASPCTCLEMCEEPQVLELEWMACDLVCERRPPQLLGLVNNSVDIHSNHRVNTTIGFALDLAPLD